MSIPTAIPVRPQAIVTPLQRSIVVILMTLLLLGLSFFYLNRAFTSSAQLSPDALDTVQAARRFAGTGTFSTNVLRPLVVRYVHPNPDGSLPDVGHAPLYSALAGIAMRLRGQTHGGEGDLVAVRVSLLGFLTSLVAVYLLSLRLFGARGAGIATLLYALAANALTIAILPGPMTIAATFFALLLAALFSLDGADGRGRTVVAGWAAAAGALWGLLFLSLYSSLVLLPPLLVYVGIVTRRNRGAALGAFLAAALVISAPLLLRNFRATGNPLFHARLLELVMDTETYPGYMLYRSAGMTQSVGSYLASGGLSEVVRKAGRNLMGYYTQLPAAFGVLLLPLFLAASLTRFTQARINRLRFLVYVLIGLHVLTLSLFVPYREGAPLLLMYLPFVAVLGTAFLLNFIRARNLPSFWARTFTFGWVALACLPGLLLLFGVRETPPPVLAAPSALNTLVPTNILREQRNGLIASDAPQETVYWTDVPVVWLPGSSSDLRVVASYVGKRVVGILLTPASEQRYNNESDMDAWKLARQRWSALYFTASLLPSRADKEELGRKIGPNALNPQQISDILTNDFRATPIAEPNFGDQYSLIFWDNRFFPSTMQ